MASTRRQPWAGVGLLLALLLVGSARAHQDPGKWKPKTKAGSYTPSRVDWASLVSACRAAVHSEKRLGGFLLRLAFHDSAAVDLKECLAGNVESCGGADASVFLTEEQFREENEHDGLSSITKRVLTRIASFYDASLADTLAVCSTVAVEELSHGRVRILGTGGHPNFRVGRLDSTRAAPAGKLPGDAMTAPEFAAHWPTMGFTVEEGVALMGSHSLLEIQACRTGPHPDDVCNPEKGDCSGKTRLFQWKNAYFQDLCTPSVKIQRVKAEAEPLIKDLSEHEYREERRKAMCRWSSPAHQQRVLKELEDFRTGRVTEEPHPPESDTVLAVTWSNKGCSSGRSWGADPGHCKHTQEWLYTVNDAYLAQACHGKAPSKETTRPITTAMRRFLNESAWDVVFPSAWRKVLTKFARFDDGRVVAIHGRECTRAYTLDKHCLAAQDYRGPAPDCRKCEQGAASCHACCICPTAFRADGRAIRSGSELEDVHVVDLE